MKAVGWISAVCCAATTPAFSTPETEQSPYRAVFEAIITAIDHRFYDPHLKGVDWSAVAEDAEERAIRATDDQQFLTVMRTVIGELDSSHLDLLPPARSQAAGLGIGLRFRDIGDRRFVQYVEALSDAGRVGISPGFELVSGRDRLTAPLGTSDTFVFRRCDGTTIEATLDHVRAFWPPEEPAFHWRTVEWGQGRTIGYLRVDRFGDGAASLADQAMDALGDTDGLIVDLRRNPGGNASAIRLASYFVDGPQLAFTLLTRPYLEGLGHPATQVDAVAAPPVSGAYTTEAIFSALNSNGGAAAFYTEDMGERRYDGAVVILTSSITASAAEGFAWFMKLRSEAILIGEQTAGALLSAETLDLADGWRLTMPVHGLWGPDGQDLSDMALPPHITVTWNPEAACNGEDPALAEAVNRLRSVLWANDL